MLDEQPRDHGLAQGKEHAVGLEAPVVDALLNLPHQRAEDSLHAFERGQQRFALVGERVSTSGLPGGGRDRPP